MKILSSAQTREADAYTILHEPITSIDLMERASEAFVDWFIKKFDVDNKVLVIAGSGNNGGDALAIARLLYIKKYQVKVYLAASQNQGSADYATNLKRLPPEVKFIERINFDHNVILDGIFGSGISRPITGELGLLIEQINSSSKNIISIDIASGLSPDGVPLNGSTITPTITISFQLPKLALMLPEHSLNVGDWQVVDIGLDETFIKEQDSNFNYLTEVEATQLFTPRHKFAHKGSFGHALIVGGSFGKIGAIVLSSRACLRAGAGLLTSLVPTCGYQILQTSCPEVMCLVNGNKHLVNQPIEGIEKYAAIGIGPGMGTNPASLSLFQSLLKVYKKPMVIDADALNLISQNPKLIELVPKGSILTPHIGEFNRLVGESSSGLERLKKQQEFCKRHKLIMVLKGAHSSISNIDGTVWFNSTGNPGMATAGSGDVLTGIITGLLAQGYDSFDAARLGVYLHGKAGDYAANEFGEASLIASDISKRISSAFISIM